MHVRGGAVTAEMSHAVNEGGAHLMQRGAQMTPHRFAYRHYKAGEVAGSSLDDTLPVGASCHSIAEAETAYHHLGPRLHYLLVGTMYPTPSHPDKHPEGPCMLSAVRQHFAVRGVCPELIAIGGVTPGRVEELVAHGAGGVAVAGYIMQAKAPETAAAEVKRSLTEALGNGVDGAE